MGSGHSSESDRPGVRSRHARIIIALLGVIVVVLVGAALKATYLVTMPVVFAFFLALLMHPVQRWLEEHLPQKLGWLSLVLTMALIVGAVALVGGGVWLSVTIVAEQAPEYADRLQGMATAFADWLRSRGLPVPQVGGDDGMLVNAAQVLAGAVLSLWTVVGIMVLIFFFALLMLIESSSWRRKTRSALADSRTAAVLDTVDVIAAKVRGYLLMRTVTSALSAVFAGIWLTVMGVDFALVWAMLTFVLNYVPNVGSIIAVIPPTLVALLQLGPGWALVTIGGLTVGEQIIGNYIDPRLQGRTLDVSPLVVLIAVIFWGWIWGAAGAVLAVPITVTLIIVCAQVPALRPIAQLLAGSAEPEGLRGEPQS